VGWVRWVLLEGGRNRWAALVVGLAFVALAAGSFLSRPR
jgi:hypothetical protein